MNDFNKMYVKSRYGTTEPLNMAEYTRNIHDLIFADPVREFTLYGPDKRTPIGKVFHGDFYPDTRFHAEATGIDTSGW